MLEAAAICNTFKELKTIPALKKNRTYDRIECPQCNLALRSGAVSVFAANPATASPAGWHWEPAGGPARGKMKRDNCSTDRASTSVWGGNKLRWVAVSLVIAALSIWAVTSQWKNFSLGAFVDYVSGADPRWIAGAVAAMLGFVFFEGCAIRSACCALHYNVPLRSHMRYAAADIYFSAITPSASGGQPACAFLMMRDGIPGIVSTAVLLLTLSMYALSILVIGLLSAALRPSVLMSFSAPSLVLIGIGYIVQIALALFLFLLIRSESLLEKLSRQTIHLLAKLHIVRHEKKRLEKLKTTMAEYRSCIALFSGHRQMLLHAFLFNLLQRASQIAVTVMVFIAMGGPPRQALSLFAMQSFVVIGSNCVPIPGAMGVADYLMLDGFQTFLQSDQVFGMELLSRSISFYSCVLLCGLTVLITTYGARKVFKR